MTVMILAPHGLPQTGIQLPSPSMGDTKSPVSDVVIKNSMDGTLYSYVKSNNRIMLSWDFNLSNQKAVELEEFIKVYSTEDMRIYDWAERIYVCKLLNTPFTFSTSMRNERKTIRLQFEGVELV